MPLRHLLFRCPACGQDPVRGEHDLVSCPACGARYTRGQGARIAVTGSDLLSGEHPAWELADRIDEHGGALSAAARPDRTHRYEAVAERRFVADEMPVRDRRRLMGFAERLTPPEPGRLTVDDEALWFRPQPGDDLDRYALDDVRSIQAASSSLQLRLADGETLSFRFPSDSPRRWEELLRHLVAAAWAEAGRGEVVEYQPDVRTARELAEKGAPGVVTASVGSRGWTPPRRGAWYVAGRVVASVLVRLRVELEVTGREHVPSDGPFVLAVDHRSILDPVFALVACPRALYALTKSTQFATPGWRRLLTRLLAFPTRRYRVDPHAVRTALRLVAAGRCLGIFPEGERAWDGRLQGLRPGAVRLLLATGVPVVPCAVVGAYDVLPRWSSRPARGLPVSVRFGAPVPLREAADAGEDGEEPGDAVRRASRCLVDAFESLGGTTPEAPA